jgi:replicative DNA helicase
MERDEEDPDIVKTHITLIDKYIKMRKGDYIVITAPTGTGKSILATSILENVCVTHHLPGLYVSLESPASEIVERIFAGVSRIPMGTKAKQLSDEHLANAVNAAAKIKNCHMDIRDDLFELYSITAAVREEILRNPKLALVVIDYIQLVKGYRHKGDSKATEIGGISRIFRVLAMKTKVPIIVIAQENHSGDPRESMAIAQDATAWMQIRDEGDITRRNIHIKKNRNGPTGDSFDVSFKGHLGRMENLVISKNTP